MPPHQFRERTIKSLLISNRYMHTHTNRSISIQKALREKQMQIITSTFRLRILKWKQTKKENKNLRVHHTTSITQHSKFGRFVLRAVAVPFFLFFVYPTYKRHITPTRLLHPLDHHRSPI